MLEGLLAVAGATTQILHTIQDMRYNSAKERKRYRTKGGGVGLGWGKGGVTEDKSNQMKRDDMVCRKKN